MICAKCGGSRPNPEGLFFVVYRVTPTNEAFEYWCRLDFRDAVGPIL